MNCARLYLTAAPMVRCSINRKDLSFEQQRCEIRPIGYYANLRIVGEKTSGGSVQLWSWRVQFIGTVDYPRDWGGCPPMGVLTEVQFGPGAGKISFDAKLTTRMRSCVKHQGVPSHDLLSFREILKADRLEGEVTLRNLLDSPPEIVDKREGLVLRLENDCSLRSFEADQICWWHLEPTWKPRAPDW